jgi:mRNA interferase RelE/StbE
LNLIFKQSLLKDLKKVQDKGLLKRVQTVIEEIESADSVNELRQFRKLEGSDFYYRIRIGDYRLGLRLEGDTVTLVRFLHRKEIYRYFP